MAEIKSDTFVSMVPFKELDTDELIKLLDKNKLIASAVASGERIYIRQWTVECTDDDCDCTHDIAKEWAMPDGTIQIEYSHTAFDECDNKRDCEYDY